MTGKCIHRWGRWNLIKKNGKKIMLWRECLLCDDLFMKSLPNIDVREEADAFVELGRHFIEKKDRETGIHFLKTALHIFKDLNDDNQIRQIEVLIAKI